MMTKSDMTEEEWLSCTDTALMLNFLRGKMSDRKLRLLLAACCRRNWCKLTDERSRQAVLVGERYADSLASKKELAEARSAALSANRDALVRHPQQTWDAPNVITWTVVREKIAAGIKGALRTAYFLEWIESGYDSQAYLLRDIIGNPFCSIDLSPNVLLWNDAIVSRLARVAYDERHLPAGLLNTTRLAILADALEEAGCDNTDILNHCRQPGEHVRGCWVIDLLLNKS